MGIRKWRLPATSAEYNSWRAMKARCLSKYHKAYHNYGGRGIDICQRWLSSFDCFLDDMGNRPPNTSLERVDNNRGYYPDNCVWATTTTQHNNQRTNVVVEYNGRAYTIAELAKEVGIGYDTLHKRLTKYDMPVERAIVKGRVNVASHGSRTMYELHKCRCDACRASNAARARKWRATR